MQLYSARLAGPVEAAIPRLAELGYDGVEVVVGAVVNTERLAGLLADHGLAARSGHFALGPLEGDSAAAISTARALGIRTVVVPFLDPADRPGDAAGWRALGGRLARVAERLSRGGLALAWHNHDFELASLEDGTRPLDHLVNLGRGVLWEADLAWIVRAGADPLRWLERHRGAVRLVHVKDLAPVGTTAEGGWADPGHGTMDWPALWSAALAAGAEAMIAEHDEPSSFDRFARRAADAMRRLDG